MSHDQRRGIMVWDWQNGVSREECVYLPQERGLHMCMCVSVCLDNVLTQVLNGWMR